MKDTSEILFWMGLYSECACIVVLIAGLVLGPSASSALNFLAIQSVPLILFLAAAITRYFFKTEK